MNWDEGLHWSLSSVAAPYVDPLLVSEAKLHLRIESSVTDEDDLVSGLIQTARAYVEQDGRRLVTQTQRLTMDGFPCGRIIELPCWPVQSISSITYIDENGDSQTLSAAYYRLDSFSLRPRIELDDAQSWPSTARRTNAVTITFVAGYRSEFTAASTDILTLVNPIELPINGRVLRVTTTDSDLPSPLAIDTDYYAINSSRKTCKLSTTSGGSAVDIADAGTGTHYIHGLIPANVRAAMKLMMGHWYENREAINIGNIVNEIPLSAQALLNVNRVYGF